jgi:hypothetical protein
LKNGASYFLVFSGKAKKSRERSLDFSGGFGYTSLIIGIFVLNYKRQYSIVKKVSYKYYSKGRKKKQAKFRQELLNFFEARTNDYCE